MRDHFTNRVELIPLPDGVNWRTVKPFGFWTGATGLIEVPAHFKTDLASIPRLFWNILPPFGKYTEAAVIHDYLYRTHLFGDRKLADRTLLAGMRAGGTSWLSRTIIYLAVRWFGEVAWFDDSRHLELPAHARAAFHDRLYSHAVKHTRSHYD